MIPLNTHNPQLRIVGVLEIGADFETRVITNSISLFGDILGQSSGNTFGKSLTAGISLTSFACRLAKLGLDSFDRVLTPR